MNKTKQIVLEATDGLLGSAVNTVLFWLYLTGASFGKSKTSYGAHQMFREAHEALRDFNYESFKQIIKNLQKHGFIQKPKRYSAFEITITKLGKERLDSLLSTYQPDRPWDGYVYLISYDIPENKHRSRDLLREYLRRLGCALLQESLWITPYNPRKLIDEFTGEHGIDGTILISRLGHDGAVGLESFEQLLERVYGLRKLNERYEEFLKEARTRSFQPFQLVVRYQSILKDDPQLPFALLPSWWKGDEAYAQNCKFLQ